MTGRVVVTGGCGALGRQVVAALAGKGHDVAVVDLMAAKALDGARLVEGGVDLAERGAVEAAYAEIASALGGIDAVVNIAGGFVFEAVEGGKDESWDAMYRINLRTALVSARAALTHLGRGGAIVNVGAAGAASPGAGMAPYAASKAGVRALTESLADEVRGRGIRVNAILPTTFDTPANRRDMPHADRAGWVQPAAAADAIAFLISDAARAISGASILLSMGG